MSINSSLDFTNRCCKRLLSKLRRNTIFLIVLVGWLSVIGVGLGFLWSYENTPGAAAKPPSRWPSESVIKPAAGRNTLVMLAHPQCPCTRASLEELDKLMAHCQGRLDTYVVLSKPAGFSDDWVKASLWRRASLIPGVRVLIDFEGVEAKRFHAATSGQVVLYSPDGRMLFSGGITGSRGHAGDNLGASAVESLVNTGSSNENQSSVFGCPMFNPDSECRKGDDPVGN